MIAYLLPLLQGLGTSLALAGSALLAAAPLTLCCTRVLTLRIPLLRRIVQLYLLLFTGTPLLVQIFLIYYGPGQFETVKNSPFWPWLSSPTFCAIFALALNSAAYSTQLLYQTVRAIPHHYWQACAVLGMDRRQAWSVLAPLAIRRAIPAYSNEIILVIKGTALTSTITLMELLGQAQQLNSQTYDTLTIFSLAGVFYLVTTGLLSYALGQIEMRLCAFKCS